MTNERVDYCNDLLLVVNTMGTVGHKFKIRVHP